MRVCVACVRACVCVFACLINIFFNLIQIEDNISMHKLRRLKAIFKRTNIPDTYKCTTYLYRNIIIKRKKSVSLILNIDKVPASHTVCCREFQAFITRCIQNYF